MHFSKLLFLLLLGTNTFAQCDMSRRPVVFLHGFLASGDTYAGQVQRLVSRGYCADRLFMFDWNSTGGRGVKADSLLDVFIDGVLRQTGAGQVDLVGHSAGGGIGRGYLLDTNHAKKVAHYVHLGSRKWSYEYNWFPNRRCLNIYSTGDQATGSLGGEVAGATNLDLVDKDHYQVATSEETFEAIYTFLQDGNAQSLSPAPIMTDLHMGGKAVLLGDNAPMAGATVMIYRLKPGTGQRKTKTPAARFIVQADGSWGPVRISRKEHYEVELVPADTSQRKLSYFFEPFTQTDLHVYLRGFPQGNMVGMMLGTLPAKSDQSLIVVYNGSAAIVSGRDSLTVNTVSLSTPAIAPGKRTIISMFLYDDGDAKTGGQVLKQYNNAPFLGGADVYLPVGRKKFHLLNLNGRKIALPAVPSSERILLAVFR